MFKEKKTQKIDEIDTVIGPGTSFEGNIQATGIVRVDGNFKGDISTQGDIIIGEKGRAEGKLQSKNMVVAGTSFANLFCSGKLHIRSTGTVIGDVVIDSIVIEEKAVFEGKCLMKHEENFNKEKVESKKESVDE